MDDPVLGDDDEIAQRKARMRLAQRTYRAKKADALAIAEDKAHKLEQALHGILSSFETLQQHIREPQSLSPAQVNLHMSTAALNISAYAKACGITTSFGSGGKPDSASNSLMCATKIVDDRSFRASMGRAANSIASGQATPTRLSHALLECLIAHRDKPMSADMMRQFASDAVYVRRDVPVPRPFGNNPPPLYRRVEGSSRMFPRIAAPHLQRLEYGLTRTWVETDLPGLTGEWLEAVDVEEYLAARGIFLHDDTENSLINLELKVPGASTPPANTRSPDSGYGSEQTQRQGEDAYLATDIIMAGRRAADWAIFGRRVHEVHQVPTGVQVFASSSPFWGSDGFIDDPMVSEHREKAHAIDRSAYVVTLNIDKLIEGLAMKTICLGTSPGIRRESVDEAIREAVIR